MLRRAVAQVNNYLADQSIPGRLKPETSLSCQKDGRRNFRTWLLARFNDLLKADERMNIQRIQKSK